MSMLVSMWIATGVCVMITLLWLGVLYFFGRHLPVGLGYVWLLWATLSYVMLGITIGETIATLLITPDVHHIAQTIGYGAYYTLCAAFGFWLWKKCMGR